MVAVKLEPVSFDTMMMFLMVKLEPVSFSFNPFIVVSRKDQADTTAVMTATEGLVATT